jgi:hypothetical protein
MAEPALVGSSCHLAPAPPKSSQRFSVRQNRWYDRLHRGGGGTIDCTVASLLLCSSWPIASTISSRSAVLAPPRAPSSSSPPPPPPPPAAAAAPVRQPTLCAAQCPCTARSQTATPSGSSRGSTAAGRFCSPAVLISPAAAAETAPPPPRSTWAPQPCGARSSATWLLREASEGRCQRQPAG